MRLRGMGGLAVLLLLGLGSGCAPRRGAADLTPRRESDPRHLPDGLVVARETQSRTEKRIERFSMKAAPLMDWALLGLAVALRPYGSIGTVVAGLCAVGPSCLRSFPRVP